MQVFQQKSYKMKRKVCIFTGTRAEYGLLKPLIDELKTNKSIELQMIISGMHLSPEFGLTYKEIEMQGISKVEKIEILLSSDTPVAISKSIGLGFISFSEALSRLKPDIFVGLGDRFELFSAVSTCLVLKIPVAHIHGGEETIGAIDNAFRHAITKMAHLHFTSTIEYKRRVIQLGENPERVFYVGAIGLDNIKKMKLLSKNELEKELNFEIKFPTILLSFHPVTLEENTSKKHFTEILKAIDNFKDLKIIFTKTNSDTYGRIINKMIDDYVKKNPEKAIVYESLGQLKYLSCMSYVDGIVGNSSSGIIEAPSFKIGTVNIGDRQKGRIKARSVIDCKPEEKEIVDAIKKILDVKFRKSLINLKNPYDLGDGNLASKKISEVLLNFKLDDLIKKEFYNLKIKGLKC